MIPIVFSLTGAFKIVISRLGFIAFLLTVILATIALSQTKDDSSSRNATKNGQENTSEKGSSKQVVIDGITRSFQQSALKAALAMKDIDSHFYESRLVFDKRLAEAESSMNQLEALNEESKPSNLILAALQIELVLRKSERDNGGSGTKTRMDREKALDELINKIKTTRVIEPLSATAPSKNVEITPGMTNEELVKILGTPLRSIVFGSKKILEYQNFTVELRANKVIDVRIK
jgi:hypothetical protein